MKKKEKHIINSLLDLDFYKLTMAQIAFIFFKYIFVIFAFKNRTKKVKIAEFVRIKDLKRELDHVRKLCVKKREIEYLRSLGNFREEFLIFLQNLRLPEYSLKEVDGQYVLEFSGNWPEVTFWETISLSIINELYFEALIRKSGINYADAIKEGRRRLNRKIRILKENPQLIFSEFGTRRRFSRLWQQYVVTRLKKELLPSQFIGTSNVRLAMKLNIKPIGTFAHEMYMVFSGIFRDENDGIKNSHNYVLKYWWKMFGKALSIALTDTYGSDFFFRDMTFEQAKKWRGLRHDSGDPIEFGEKAIRFYESYGIDPTKKVIVFSDGLNIETMLKIAKHFEGRIQCVFGWGTNLTNDLGLDALSLVVKVILANGHGTVKLSDNIAKAMGSENDIDLFKHIFSYNNFFEEVCVY